MKRYLIQLVLVSIVLLYEATAYPAPYGSGISTCPACPTCPTVSCPVCPKFTGAGVSVPITATCPQCPAPQTCPQVQPCPPTQTLVVQQSCPSVPVEQPIENLEPKQQVIPPIPPLSTEVYSKIIDKPVYYSKYDWWTVTTPDYTTEIVYLGTPVDPVVIFLTCISGYKYVITEYKNVAVNMLQLMNGKDQAICENY